MTRLSTSPPTELPASAHAIIQAVWEVLGSCAWVQALGDDYTRTWLLTRAVCGALHGAGVERVPSAAAVQNALDKLIRNQAIVAEFNGRNYRALAQQYRLSTRTVRRIVERGRRKET